MNNNPPFRPGQHVECIEDLFAVNPDNGQARVSIKKGEIFIVVGCIKCACGNWKIDIGIPAPSNTVIQCADCRRNFPNGTSTLSNPKYFRLLPPARERIKYVSVPESITKQTEKLILS